MMGLMELEGRLAAPHLVEADALEMTTDLIVCIHPQRLLPV
jgi:hypothetical protein